MDIMAVYKIKRYSSFGDSARSAIGGAVIGGLLGLGTEKKYAGRIGATLGALGGIYLNNKYSKYKEKQKQKIVENLQRKNAEQERFRYPTKDMENLYPIIEEFGGLPKEYYNAVQISKKISNLSSVPSWGDGDEYAFFHTLNLGDIEKWIENGETIENIPIICLGYQSTYMDISYNPKTKKWIDLEYNKVIGSGNSLKGYILKWFNEELKNLRIDLKKLNEDNEEFDLWKQVEKFYEDQIKIIQQSIL
jgi:hypothetical protein